MIYFKIDWSINFNILFDIFSVGTEISSLPHSPRGYPLALGDLDDNVKDWIRKVRLNGCVINTRIVMAAIEAIVTKFAHNKLQRYGGHINITKSLARSILQCMGYVKRKGTKAVKHLPKDFEDIKAKHLEKVNKVVEEHRVQDSLIIRDQTGCQLVPGGDWTMEQQGTQQITISGLDDKRQITLLLAVSKSGTLLPPQLIYAWKTDRCLPKGVAFPDSWDITYTETHWSNEESMIRYVDKVIIPYVEEIRDELPLVNTTTQKAIALFDVYKAHQSENLLSHLKKHDIVPLFVPAACTDKLQPLDLSLNREYKEELKAHFHDWYSSEVMQLLKQHEDDTSDDTTNSVVVDTKTSVIKPIHANWIIATHQRCLHEQIWSRWASVNPVYFRSYNSDIMNFIAISVICQCLCVTNCIV